MPGEESNEPDGLLCKYADSYAARSKQATRTWITLAILSIYCISVDISENPDAKLPFVDVTLPKREFAIIAMGLLAALLTHWQEIVNRLSHLRQGPVKKRIRLLKQSGTVDAKEVWDALASVNTQSVWGIVSPLEDLSGRRSSLCLLLCYVAVKIISFTVHAGLPLWAFLSLIRIYRIEWKFHTPDWQYVLFCILLSCVAVLLIIATKTEYRYDKRVVQQMWQAIKSQEQLK